jgi:glycosyltransferase involved in cell wall biosynthesis
VEVLFCPHTLLPARCPVPAVQVVHDLQVYDLPENIAPLKRAFLYRRLPAGARQAARIIAISEFTRDRVVRHLGVAAEKITVIGEAAGPEFYPRPAEEVAEIRSRHQLAAPYLLCLATSHKHKHLDRLVRAFDAFKDARPGPELLVRAGLPGSGEGEWQAALRAARHREDIHDLGRVPYAELAPLYCGAVGLVFPSGYEGFGLPVVEAMACGCPVACSDAASLPEAAGGAALLFDCDSEAEITAALRRLVEEPELRESLRTRGLVRAGELTWQETARQTLEVLHSAGRSVAVPDLVSPGAHDYNGHGR